MALNRNLWVTATDKAAWRVEGWLADRLPEGRVREPLFLIGCGRSGTTILGECIARHRRVAYLYEPRLLWTRAYPIADIWTPSAQRRGGRIVLTAADATPQQSATLQRLFAFQTRLRRRPALVEKYPINNFRLSLLAAVFPDARYVHIRRDGREVARSIQARADNPRNPWFGAGGYKWRQLVEHGRATGVCDGMDVDAFDNYERGLLEWRLSLDAFDRFRGEVPEERLFEMDYETFMGDPQGAISRVLDFARLGADDRVARFVTANVQRRTPKIDRPAYNESEQMIGGPQMLAAV